MLLLWCSPAQAGLFDDEEARKAILDLRTRIQTNDDAQRARLAELQQANAQLLEQVQQLRRGLLDLNTQLEVNRTEAAQMRGKQEQLNRDLSQLARDLTDTQKRQLDAASAVDARFRAFEPQRVTLDGKEISVEPAERRAFESAMAQLRSADFDKAALELASFVARYPGSGYVDAARFWLGNALYGLKNYRDAITHFRAMVTTAPTHPRAPEAMLAIANCQAEMKDIKAARKTLDDLIKAYPGTEAATASKERLATLKG